MLYFVKRIVVDKWTGVFCREEEFHAPRIEDLDMALDALDAKIHTLACLYGSDGSYLTIGGGAGRYVVFASGADNKIRNLIAAEGDPNQIALINIGGQEGDYSSRQIVDKEQMLQAAHLFFESGQLGSDFTWEEQA